MAYAKTAIAVPEELLADVDRAARERGESRSKYITRVLRAAVHARRDREITRRLDELFAKERVAADQKAVAATLDQIGSEWSDENW
jgi:metal-responsive CopG/Arc/MetJ family transcriptional regulator